ncbi:MAG: ATP-dependent metallopeptidase FtsH/Yme1/Tma family protein, partial [Bulleidia sp.]
MQKKSLLYYLPYMIVLLALISLFYLNSEQTPKTLSYDQLTQTIQNEKVTESVLSVGSNVITVKGTYTEQDGKVVTFTSTVPADENTTQMLLEELKG